MTIFNMAAAAILS